MLRLCGAELVEVPALPYSNPNNYQHIGRRLADELRKTEPNGVLFADQWNNLDNRKAHYMTQPARKSGSRPRARSTDSSARSAPAAPWPGSRPSCASRRKDIVIGVADPRGAAMYALFKDGTAKPSEGGRSPKASALAASTPIIEDIRSTSPI
jgi:cysteine synthase